MPNVKTVFEVDGDNYPVEGYGQETVKAALKKWPRKIVKLVGFLINEVFYKADLT